LTVHLQIFHFTNLAVFFKKAAMRIEAAIIFFCGYGALVRRSGGQSWHQVMGNIHAFPQSQIKWEQIYQV
jgi:hypothetical protein